jgi:chromosomal replication initiation ATPase DnaA
MTSSPRQLALELPHRPAFGLEDFLVSHSNEAAVALIDRWPDWPVGAAVLTGPAGSGKSHLANVWRARANAQIVSAAAITRDNLPDLISGGALVAEDLDKSAIDEQALFHVLNLVREQKIAVLLTAVRPPGELDVRLPDLRSRLRALPVAEIAPPDDALLRAVLVKLFADRQLAVDPAVIAYLLNRMERSMEAARHLVEETDKLALAMQRAVTKPVAAAALEALSRRRGPG